MRDQYDDGNRASDAPSGARPDGMSRRRLVRGAAGLTAVGAAALAACGTGGGSAAQPAALSTQPVKVVLSTDWNSTTRMAVMEMMKTEFMRAHPSVTVEVDYFTSASSTGGSAGTYSEKVIAALVANTPPDVVANFAYVPHVDRMMDITKDAPANGWKKADVVFDPYNQEVGGRLHMLAMSSSVSGWIYNKSLFQEAGIKDPTDTWTLDDVLEAAKKLTKPDKNQWGLLAPDALWFGPLELMWATGAGSTSTTSAELFSAERKKSRLGEAGGPDAFQWYVDLIQRHRVSPSPVEAKAQGVNFDTGRVGLMPFGVYNSGATAQRIKDQFQWSAMPIPLDPKTKKRCCDRNSEGFVIPKTTQQKGNYQAALRYALSFYSDPVQKMVAEQRGTLPIVRKWIESKEYLSPPPLGLEIIPKTLNDKQMIMGDHQQRHKAFPDWNRAVRAELLKALNGENAAKPALQAAMDAGDRILAASS